MAHGRSLHGAAMLQDGRVLVAGGNDGSSALASTELFDPASGTWSTAGTLAHARYLHTVPSHPVRAATSSRRRKPLARTVVVMEPSGSLSRQHQEIAVLSPSASHDDMPTENHGQVRRWPRWAGNFCATEANGDVLQDLLPAAQVWPKHISSLPSRCIGLSSGPDRPTLGPLQRGGNTFLICIYTAKTPAAHLPAGAFMYLGVFV